MLILHSDAPDAPCLCLLVG